MAIRDPSCESTGARARSIWKVGNTDTEALARASRIGGLESWHSGGLDDIPSQTDDEG